MSFRSLGKLFRARKGDKRDSKEITLPTEGFKNSIKMLLAYTGQDTPGTGTEDAEVMLESGSCGLHSVAVLRCLGRSRGLAGADPFEDLEIDKIVDVFIDLLHKIQSLGTEEPDSQAERFDEQTALAGLAKLDAVVATNKGHLALSKLTWADFLVAGTWGDVCGALPPAAAPHLARLARTLAHPLARTLAHPLAHPLAHTHTLTHTLAARAPTDGDVQDTRDTLDTLEPCDTRDGAASMSSDFSKPF